ncbi:MAG: hypothetical protein J0M34_01575 [Alphaproteobacteria bacterium]|nr:hypothetical protein [Alphaproteobacteria bacterium]
MTFDWRNHITISDESEWLSAGYSAAEYRQVIGQLNSLSRRADFRELVVDAATASGGRFTLLPSDSSDRVSSADQTTNRIYIGRESFDHRSHYYSAETGRFEPLTLENIIVHEIGHLTAFNRSLTTGEAREANAMSITNSVLPQAPEGFHHDTGMEFDSVGMILPENYDLDGVGTLLLIPLLNYIVAHDTNPGGDLRDPTDISRNFEIGAIVNDGSTLTGGAIDSNDLINALTTLPPELYEALREHRVVHYTSESGARGTIDLRSRNLATLNREIIELGTVIDSEEDESWHVAPRGPIIARSNSDEIER